MDNLNFDVAACLRFATTAGLDDIMSCSNGALYRSGLSPRMVEILLETGFLCGKVSSCFWTEEKKRAVKAMQALLNERILLVRGSRFSGSFEFAQIATQIEHIGIRYFNSLHS